MAFRAVIFDFGGVLVRTADFRLRDELAKKHGMSLDELMGLVFGRDAGTRAQLGKVTYEQHWENIRQTLKLSAAELRTFQTTFWGNDFVDLVLVEKLRNLRATHRTALLSNAFSDLRKVINEQMKIGDAFDEMIISAEVGMMKPDARIFHLTLDRLNVAPGEAVFVDDVIENISGAQAVGMHGILFKNTDQVLADLDGMLDGR